MICRGTSGTPCSCWESCVTIKSTAAAEVLRRNLLVYGLGGLVVPFVGIKLIDLLLAVCGIE